MAARAPSRSPFVASHHASIASLRHGSPARGDVMDRAWELDGAGGETSNPRSNVVRALQVFPAQRAEPVEVFVTGDPQIVASAAYAMELTVALRSSSHFRRLTCTRRQRRSPARSQSNEHGRSVAAHRSSCRPRPRRFRTARPEEACHSRGRLVDDQPTRRDRRCFRSPDAASRRDFVASTPTVSSIRTMPRRESQSEAVLSPLDATHREGNRTRSSGPVVDAAEPDAVVRWARWDVPTLPGTTLAAHV